MKKIALPLAHGNVAEVAADRILCNNVVLPGEYNPHKVRLWVVVSGGCGPLGAVWAQSVDDALDELVDADLGKALLLDDDHVGEMSEEERDNLARLGNAGEPADLTNVGVFDVQLKQLDRDVVDAFRTANEEGAGRLSEIIS